MLVLFSGVRNILVRIRITQPQGFQRHWKTLPLKFWLVKPAHPVWFEFSVMADLAKITEASPNQKIAVIIYHWGVSGIRVYTIGGTVYIMKSAPRVPNYRVQD